MILDRLPYECGNVKIKPRHWTTLEHRFVNGTVWIVYLNSKNGKNKAWKLPVQEYLRLEPKHGTRDRFVKENFRPELEDAGIVQLELQF